MQSLPNMILEDDEFSGTIFLEYLQSIFGLNEPVAFLVSSNLNMDICTDLYNYLLDNQKKLIDSIIEEFIQTWSEWIAVSYRAKQYNNLPLINTADDVIYLFCPYYVGISDDYEDGYKISFVFVPRKGKLKMFSQFYLSANLDRNTLHKVELELDDIPYISAKYRSEKEEKWHNSN